MLQTIKPRTLGILTKPERRRGGVAFIVSALGLFDLASPDDFLSEQAIWPMVAKELPQGQMLDAAMPKPRAEVLIAGKAMAPGGRPVKAMTVDVRIANVAKRLRVFGDRHWHRTRDGVVFTEPAPFVELPLEPGRAFGGPTHPTNPAGLGYRAGALLAGGAPVPLPNIEDERFPLRNVDDNPPPVRIGPIDPGSPERLKYAGTYDGTWLTRDFPGLPQDVDPRLFLVAPEDQWIEGYLRGDEPFRIAGFSAKHPDVEGRLPGMRVRCVIERTSAPEGAFEIDMRIDTLWLFPSQNKGLLIYRGALATQDIDGRDVRTILLAYERMTAERRPAAHYVEQIALRTGADPAVALKLLLADQHLRPEPDPAETERRRQARLAFNQHLVTRHTEGQRYFLAQQAARAGVSPALLPDVPDAEPPPFLVPSPEDVERGEVDLAALIDGLETFARDQLAELDQRTRDLAAMAGDAVPGSIGDIDALISRLAPEAASAGGVRAALEGVRESIVVPEGGDPASAETARSGLAQIDALLSGPLAGPAKDEETQFAEASARYRGLPEGSPFHLARTALSDARASVPELPERPADQAAPAPLAVGNVLAGIALADDAPEHARTMLAQAGPRLDEVDAKLRAALPKLEGPTALDGLLATLSVQDGATASPATLDESLREAEQKVQRAIEEGESGLRMLRRTAPAPTHPIEPLSPRVARRLGDLVLDDLRAGRSLAGADLAGVDLRGADLSGRDLRATMFERADLRQSRLAGALCADAVFAGADLSGADLGRTDLTGANFGSANLAGARLVGARIKAAMFLEAKPAGADFTRASLEELQILNVDLSGIRLDGARLTNVIVLSCALTGLSARSAELSSCQFLQGDAAGADFAGARLHRCVFMRISLPRASFAGTTLESVGFLGNCDLVGADFANAKGQSAGFHGADLAGATFDDAIMEQSSFMEANLPGASFRLTSLRGTMMSSAMLRGSDLFGANLLGGQLRRADLAGASLRNANLYSCDLSDADLTAADLSFANLGKTRFLIATP